MTRTDVRFIQFPDEENRNVNRKSGSFAFQPPAADVSPRKFYRIQSPSELQIT